MKYKYDLSKDYDNLYNLVKLGGKIVCFVDYNFQELKGKYPPSRDVCVCKKTHEIDFGCRGRSYDSISEYDIKRHGLTEKKLFISACKRLNVEFINP